MLIGGTWQIRLFLHAEHILERWHEQGRWGAGGEYKGRVHKARRIIRRRPSPLCRTCIRERVPQPPTIRCALLHQLLLALIDTEAPARRARGDVVTPPPTRRRWQVVRRGHRNRRLVPCRRRHESLPISLEPQHAHAMQTHRIQRLTESIRQRSEIL